MTDKAIEVAYDAAIANSDPPDFYPTREMIEAAISAYLTQLEADGFVMVPVEASEEMLEAALCRSQKSTLEEGLYASAYRAMIAARPQVKG